jgi:hypothetical protein
MQIANLKHGWLRMNSPQSAYLPNRAAESDKFQPLARALSVPAAEPLAMTVKQFRQRFGISHSGFYNALKRNEIRTIIVAGRRLVPIEEVKRLLAGA